MTEGNLQVEMLMEACGSPAITEQSDSYPAKYNGNVPIKIKMLQTVRSDVPFGERLVAEVDKEYYCWVNSHGAVAAIISPGQQLGVKSVEFEVVEFYHS